MSDQNEILNTFNKSDGIKDFTTDDLMDYVDAYGAQRQQLDEKKQDLQRENELLSGKINDSFYKAQENTDVTPPNGKVTFVLVSNENCDAEVTFSYIISGPSWSPQYDVHAILARDHKAQSSVVFTFRAFVQQSTHEDWSDVILSLSTGKPNVYSYPSSNNSYSYPYPITAISPPIPITPADADITRPPSIIDDPITLSQLPFSIPPPVSPICPFPSVNRSVPQIGEIITVPGLTSIKSQYAGNHVVHICELNYDPVKLQYVTEPRKKQEVSLEV